MPGESLTLNPRERMLLGLLTVWSAFLATYLAYLGYVFWRVRQQYWMRSRWSQLDVVLLVLFVEIYTCGRPLVFYQDIREADQTFREMGNEDRILLIFVNMISLVPTTGTMMLLCLRWWKAYYDAQLAVVLSVSKWAVILDPSLAETGDTCWFIRNKSWLGNHAFLDKCGVSVWLLVSVVGCVLPFVSLVLESVFYLAVIITGMTFVGLCGYMYPPFHDEIFLRPERRIFVRFSVGFAVTWFIWAIWYRIAGMTYEDNRMIRGLDSFFRQWMIALGYSVASYILVPFVVQHFIDPVRTIPFGSSYLTIALSFDFSTIDDGNNDENSSRLGLSSRYSDTGSSSTVTLERVMTDNDAWNAFMIHLFAEFSYENALSIIECVKFRDRMRELDGIHDLDDIDRVGMPEIKFCENVTKIDSWIVSGMQSKQDARKTALRIARKYFRSDADFPVNLSFTVRKKVLNLIDDSSKMIEHSLFDHIIQANYRFLKESFSRFAVTAAFLELTIAEKRGSRLSFGSEMIKKVRQLS